MSGSELTNKLMATGVPWETATLLGELESDIQLIPTGGDDSGLIQNAMYAAAATGRSVGLSTGTFLLLNGLVWPVGLTGLIGAGPNSTVLRRMGPVSNMITAVGCSGFLVASLCLDGNKTFNAIPSNGMLFNGCSDFRASGVCSINQKTGTNYGDGIQLINTPSTAINGRGIIFDTCQCCDNDATGLHVLATGANITVQGGVYSKNAAGSGIAFERSSTPVVNTMPGVCITGVRAEYNSTGIAISGFRISGAGGIYVPGHGNDPACGVTVTDNEANHNTVYGIFVQATGGSVSGNACRYNGSTNQAGIVANAEALTISDNTVEYNRHYGIDAGGSFDTTIVGNTVRYNNDSQSSGSTSFGIGINLGACQHVVCASNVLVDNGLFNINMARNDAGATYFPWDSYDVTVDNNTIVNTVSNTLNGVSCSGMPTDIFVTNNKFTWPNSLGRTAIGLLINTGRIAGNNLVGSAMYSGYPMTSATTLEPPDWPDILLINNAGPNITAITTFNQFVFSGLVTGVGMTNRGSGYTSAPTVTPGGTWSVAPVFAAQITPDGLVAAVTITNRGSGITGAVTVAFSGGGGINAAATVFVGYNPPDGRQTTLFASATLFGIQSNAALTLPAPSNTIVTVPLLSSVVFLLQAGVYCLLSANPQNINVPNNVLLNFYDTSGGVVSLGVDGANNFNLIGTDGTGPPGAQRYIMQVLTENSVSGLNIDIPMSVGRALANFLRQSGAATGNAPTLQGAGSDTNVGIKVIGQGTSGAYLGSFSSTIDPTTSTIGSGLWALWHNSTTPSTKIYFNNAGTLQSVALA